MPSPVARRSIVALLLAVPLLVGGCLGPLFEAAPEQPAPVAEEAGLTGTLVFPVAEAAAYQVANVPEGALVEVETEDAEHIALYGPSDRRIALVDNTTLSGATPVAGDYVIATYPMGIHANIRITLLEPLDGSEPRPGVLPLPTWSERVLVREADTPEVTLLDPPTTRGIARYEQDPLALHAEYVGAGTRLAVEVSSALGAVMSWDAGPAPLAAPGSLEGGVPAFSPWWGPYGNALASLEGRSFNVSVTSDLTGEVYLTALHYQRAPAPLLFPDAWGTAASLGGLAVHGANAPAWGTPTTYQGSVVEASAYSIVVPNGTKALVVMPAGDEDEWDFDPDDPPAMLGMLTLYGPEEEVIGRIVVPNMPVPAIYPFDGSGRHVVHATNLEGKVLVGVIGAVPTDIATHRLDLETETVAVEREARLDAPVLLKATQRFERPPVAVNVRVDETTTYSDLLVTVTREDLLEHQCSGSPYAFPVFDPHRCRRVTGPMTALGLDSGAHEVRVQATDLAGRIEVVFTFFVSSPDPAFGEA